MKFITSERRYDFGRGFTSGEHNDRVFRSSAEHSARHKFSHCSMPELGPRGITVNLVNPGSTDTDMNLADGPSADAQRSFSALGRYATPDDIANAVVFLAGDGDALLRRQRQLS